MKNTRQKYVKIVRLKLIREAGFVRLGATCAVAEML